MQVLRLTPDLLINLGGEPRGLAFNKRGDSNALCCAQSLRPVRLWATPRLVTRQAPSGPWDSPGQKPGASCHFLLLSSSSALKCGNRWDAVPLTAVNCAHTGDSSGAAVTQQLTDSHPPQAQALWVRSSGPPRLLGPLPCTPAIHVSANGNLYSSPKRDIKISDMTTNVATKGERGEGGIN